MCKNRFIKSKQAQFSVSLYPRDPHLVFPSANVRRLLRLDLKHLLARDVLRADLETMVTLDSLVAQAELGDADMCEGESIRTYFAGKFADIIFLPCEGQITRKKSVAFFKEIFSNLRKEIPKSKKNPKIPKIMKKS